MAPISRPILLSSEDSTPLDAALVGCGSGLNLYAVEYPPYLIAPSVVHCTWYAWAFPIGLVEIQVFSSESVMTSDPELDTNCYGTGKGYSRDES